MGPARLQCMHANPAAIVHTCREEEHAGQEGDSVTKLHEDLSDAGERAWGHGGGRA